MPRVTNYYDKNFYLECNFIQNDSLICDEGEDYLNWIPTEMKLYIGENIYKSEFLPTLNFIGLKNFLAIRDKLIEEKKYLRIQSNDIYDREYSTFSYYATEADFEILFKNLYDNDREVPVVEATIWYSRGGYKEGYCFMTTLEECICFFDELKSQFINLTQ